MRGRYLGYHALAVSNFAVTTECDVEVLCCERE